MNRRSYNDSSVRLFYNGTLKGEVNLGSVMSHRAQRRLWRIYPVLGLIFLCSCSHQAELQKTSVGPLFSLEIKAAAADAFFREGCYVGFKKALVIYDELYPRLAIRNRITVPYLKALILMSVRENELGILNDKYIRRSREIINENPSLQPFIPYVELTEAMPLKTKGIMKDIDVMATVKIVNDNLKDPRLKGDMKLKALSDDYFAYLYTSFCLGFSNYLDGKDDLSEFKELFPNSILMKYRNATTYPHQDAEALKILAQAESDFYEAYFHLGELAIGQDKPLDVENDSLKPIDAERYFLKALEGIPELSQATIYLGAIYMAEEEYDSSLDYYEKTISLAPGYRDALLGKASCLSYLGKHLEAIKILNEITAMGYYLIGESHYWLAWNYYQIKENEKAQDHVEESKVRLPTNSEVFSLAGAIALEKNQLAIAEREFEDALRFNGRNINAVLGLGQVYAAEQKWIESALFYATGARLASQRINEKDEFIVQIEKAALDEGRISRMVAKRKQQITSLESTMAFCFYSSSVGYFKSGQKGRALELALKAAVNPQYKESAEDLIKKIKHKDHIDGKDRSVFDDLNPGR